MEFSNLTFTCLLIILSQFSVSFSKSTGPKVVYFPDPKNEGSYIPGFLEGNSPKRPGNESDVYFYLVTRNNPDSADELFVGDLEALQGSHYIKDAPLKVLTHGFGGSWTDPFPRRTAAALLESDNVNVIMVDWSAMTENPWYNIAAASAKWVGNYSAKMISFLVEQNVTSLDKVHVIGFSLGCHTAGNIGQALGGKVSRVTGLDPALPLFDVADDEDRIDPTDGQFVDVIHTAGGYLWENGIAFLTPRGDADFYPNEGRSQPGCEGEGYGTCSHQRAPSYFDESLRNENGFPGCKCEDVLRKACDCSQTVLMGIATPSSARGSYYFRTASSSPYALGEDGLENETAKI